MITPDLPNPDKMKTTIEALENGINALVASPDYKGNYESLENAASSIVKDAKKIMREAREKKTEKWSKRDFNRNITDWIEAYNQMKPEDSFLKKVVFAGE